MACRGMLTTLCVVVMLFASFANAQTIAATSLCNTGPDTRESPPNGCSTSTLIYPINLINGGPIVDGNWELAVPYSAKQRWHL